MVTFSVKGIEIGGGLPKICVPVAGACENEVLAGLSAVYESASGVADIIEWRADYLGEGCDKRAIISLMEQISERYDKIPLIFTFRTKNEGGLKDISADEYLSLCEYLIKSRLADILDIELQMAGKGVQPLISLAKAHGQRILISYHNFFETPSEEALIKKLGDMQKTGADIAKIAVMPRNAVDCLTLLSAAYKAKAQGVGIPVIAISMGGLGIISRIGGEIFASAITFGSLGEKSAPGQLPAHDLRTVLSIIHDNFS